MTHHPLGSLPIDEQPMRGPAQLGDPEKMRCLYCQQTLYVRDRRLETCWKAAE
jgi:hypothetical protein